MIIFVELIPQLQYNTQTLKPGDKNKMFNTDSSTLLVETLIEDQCKEVDTNCELYCKLETDGCLNILIKTSTIKSMVKKLKTLRQVSQVDIVDDNAIRVYIYNAL